MLVIQSPTLALLHQVRQLLRLPQATWRPSREETRIAAELPFGL